MHLRRWFCLHSDVLRRDGVLGVRCEKCGRETETPITARPRYRQGWETPDGRERMGKPRKPALAWRVKS